MSYYSSQHCPAFANRYKSLSFSLEKKYEDKILTGQIITAPSPVNNTPEKNTNTRPGIAGSRR
jgi:hypothetical protein